MELFLNKKPILRSNLNISMSADLLESNKILDKDNYFVFFWQLICYKADLRVVVEPVPHMFDDLLFDVEIIWDVLTADGPCGADFLIRQIKETLCSGSYVFCDINERYIRGRQAFEFDRPFFHGNLIYGYDDANETFLCTAQIRGHYTAAYIPYSDFIRCVEARNSSSVNNGAGIVEIDGNLKLAAAVKPKNIPYFKPQADALSRLIRAYLNSEDYLFEYARDSFFGLDALEKFAGTITQNSTLSMPMIYGIFEHKQAMLDRIRFVAAQSGSERTDVVDKIIEEYSSVASLYNKTALMFLKGNVSGRRPDMQFVQDRFFGLIEQERRCLEEFMLSVP